MSAFTLATDAVRRLRRRRLVVNSAPGRQATRGRARLRTPARDPQFRAKGRDTGESSIGLHTVASACPRITQVHLAVGWPKQLLQSAIQLVLQERFG